MCISSWGGSRNFVKGAYPPPHMNAEGARKNEKFVEAPNVRKKSACQISVFLASGIKI